MAPVHFVMRLVPEIAKFGLLDTSKVHGIVTPSVFFAVSTPTVVPAVALLLTVKLLILIVMRLSGAGK